MNKAVWLFPILAPALLLAYLAAPSGCVAAEVQGTKFFLGADVSALGAPSRGGGQGALRSYQEDGKTNEEWAILMNHAASALSLALAQHQLNGPTHP